jgi:hypothetical protein
MRHTSFIPPSGGDFIAGIIFSNLYYQFICNMMEKYKKTPLEMAQACVKNSNSCVPGGLCKFYANAGGKRQMQITAPTTLSAIQAASQFINAQLYSTCVRHVTGNDQDYLRKIPRVVVQKSALL